MVLLEYKTEKRNRQCEQEHKKLVLHVRLRCGLLSITTPESLLANDLMLEAYCTGKNLAAVNQMYVIHNKYSAIDVDMMLF